MPKPAILIFLVAVTATSLVIFGLVMPAYYRIDPLGWGAKLGINGIVDQFKKNAPAALGNNNPTLPATPPPHASSADSAPEDGSDPLMPRQTTIELTIAPQQTLDYRLKMERDYELDYYWKTDDQPIYAELRGEPDNAKNNESKTFGKPLLGNAGKGFFIAPFNGTFGWHWVNKSEQEIKVKITAKGIYQIINQSDNSSPK